MTLKFVHRSNVILLQVVFLSQTNYFQECKFDMAQVVAFFHHNTDGNLAIYYEMHESEATNSRGIVEICSNTNR